jgi:hypothetical protein
VHLFLHILGVDDASGRWYLWWSGIAADISEVAIFGGLFGVYRRHQCEVARCWRLGRHRTAASHFVCRRHHPDDHLTAEAVAAAHEEASR